MEKEIREKIDGEIERFRLEAENKVLEATGHIAQAVQCVKSVEMMYKDTTEKVSDMSKKFSAIKLWLLGTNGNSINEDDIHESFIVRFKKVEDFINTHKPWYLRLWDFVKKYPKTSGAIALLVLNALGFSTVGIVNFLQKFNLLTLELNKIIP